MSFACASSSSSSFPIFLFPVFSFLRDPPSAHTHTHLLLCGRPAFHTYTSSPCIHKNAHSCNGWGHEHRCWKESLPFEYTVQWVQVLEALDWGVQGWCNAACPRKTWSTLRKSFGRRRTLDEAGAGQHRVGPRGPRGQLWTFLFPWEWPL